MHDRWVLAANLVSESAWVFAALGAAAVVGSGPGGGSPGSPLSWPALLAIMGSSMFLARLGRLKFSSVDVTQTVRPLLGVTVVYLTVGTQIVPGSGGIDLLWVTRFGSPTAPEGFTFTAVWGSVIGTVMWWRAGGLGAGDEPVLSLERSFRFGLLALAIATAVDIVSDVSIYAFPMVFVFFASALGGLSIGHLLPESEDSTSAGAWPKVISGTIAGIVAIGLFFMVFYRGLLSYLFEPLLTALSAVAAVIVWVVFVPIAFLLNLFNDLLIALFSRDIDQEAQRPSPRFDRGPEDRREPLEEASGEGAESLFDFVQLVEWALLALVALVLLYVLAMAFRRVLSGGRARSEGQRESVREEADPMSDVARLLWQLLPDWLKQRRAKDGLTLPDGPPGIVSPLRIYYQLLSMAEDRGIARGSHQTSIEFQRTLEALFPHDLVRTATAAFNRAFYGLHPSSDVDIAKLESALQAIPGDKPGRGSRAPASP